MCWQIDETEQTTVRLHLCTCPCVDARHSLRLNDSL